MLYYYLNEKCHYKISEVVESAEWWFEGHIPPSRVYENLQGKRDKTKLIKHNLKKYNEYIFYLEKCFSLLISIYK